MTEPSHLAQLARTIFAEALERVDANKAVRQAVQLEHSQLMVGDTKFDLSARPQPIYAIALGKAANAMATALDDILGEKLAGGVLSTASIDASLSQRWQTFAGGHPLPNEASLQAARAAFELLRQADEAAGLVIFLVSGGGSAMIEEARDKRITLAELQAMNRALVHCGATIAEVNAVRRAVSAVKGGGLSTCAPRAHQVTLIISDTNSGEAATVASGPTLAPPAQDEFDARSVIERYHLTARLPASVLRAVNEWQAHHKQQALPQTSFHRYFVLLDNEHAITAAAESAKRHGCAVAVASGLVEQPVIEGSARLVRQAFEERARMPRIAGVLCLVSGGEFRCVVKGTGIGGRNAETALRCAFEIESQGKQLLDSGLNVVVLSAGTDGIDGNSPAAGALCTNTTLQRARQLNLDAHSFLEASDAYTFFRALGDNVVTGPTGTNVRDLRLVLVGN